MKVATAFLAEGISITDGVVDVRRGWPEWWWVETIPGAMEVVVGVIVEYEPTEMGAEFVFELVLRQEGVELARGRVGLTPARTGEFVAGVPFHHPFALKFEGVSVTNVGQCEIEVLHEGASLATVRFVLRLKPE